jgi:hypothetical protein
MDPHWLTAHGYAKLHARCRVQSCGHKCHSMTYLWAVPHDRMHCPDALILNVTPAFPIV